MIDRIEESCSSVPSVERERVALARLTNRDEVQKKLISIAHGCAWRAEKKGTKNPIAITHRGFWTPEEAQDALL